MKILVYSLVCICLISSVAAWDGSYRGTTALIEESLEGIQGNPEKISTSLNIGREGSSIRGRSIILTDQRERIVIEYLKVSSRTRDQSVMVYVVQGKIKAQKNTYPATFTLIMDPAEGTAIVESDLIYIQHTDFKRLGR